MTTNNAAYFSCPQCDRKVKWRNEIAGRNVKCQCTAIFKAPNSIPLNEVQFNVKSIQQSEDYELDVPPPQSLPRRTPRPVQQQHRSSDEDEETSRMKYFWYYKMPSTAVFLFIVGGVTFGAQDYIGARAIWSGLAAIGGGIALLCLVVWRAIQDHRSSTENDPDTE